MAGLCMGSFTCWEAAADRAKDQSPAAGIKVPAFQPHMEPVVEGRLAPGLWHEPSDHLNELDPGCVKRGNRKDPGGAAAVSIHGFAS